VFVFQKKNIEIESYYEAWEFILKVMFSSKKTGHMQAPINTADRIASSKETK